MIASMLMLTMLRLTAWFLRVVEPAEEEDDGDLLLMMVLTNCEKDNVAADDVDDGDVDGCFVLILRLPLLLLLLPLLLLLVCDGAGDNGEGDDALSLLPSG